MFRPAFLLVVLAVGALAASLQDNGVFRIQLKQYKNAGYVSALRSHLRDSGTVNQTLVDEHNINYQGEIHVGTPNQTFTVDFDTGSPELWLVVEGCKSGIFSSCKSPHKYDPKKSNTSHDTGTAFEIHYGSGSASGEFYSDVVGLTADPQVANIKNFTFGGAKRLTGMPGTFDGLFGLSFATKDNPNAFIDHLAKEKTFEPPVFTIWLDNEPKDVTKFAGELIFGAAGDTERCGAVVATTKAQVLPTDTWWTFKIDDVKLNGKSIGRDQIGVSDTGTTAAYLSSKLFEPLAAKYPVLASRFGVECEEAKKQLKDFKLEFQVGNATLVLDGNDAIIQSGKGGGQCVSGIQEDDFGGTGFQLLLGDPFIRKYCQIHNYVEKTLGFAPSKSSNSTA